jgi:hypothetical protein
MDDSIRDERGCLVLAPALKADAPVLGVVGLPPEQSG